MRGRGGARLALVQRADDGRHGVAEELRGVCGVQEGDGAGVGEIADLEAELGQTDRRERMWSVGWIGGGGSGL